MPRVNLIAGEWFESKPNPTGKQPHAIAPRIRRPNFCYNQLMIKLSRNNAQPYGRTGVRAFNYPFPDINGGSSVIYAELTGEHGERTIGERARLYYILDGTGEFVINRKKTPVESGDVIVIPPNGVYNYWPTKSTTLRCLLYMELLDITKLPK